MKQTEKEQSEECKGHRLNGKSWKQSEQRVSQGMNHHWGQEQGMSKTMTRKGCLILGDLQLNCLSGLMGRGQDTPGEEYM